MNNIFNADNMIFQIINKIAEYFYLSILWLLFSLPIITLGSSTTALYYTANKVIISKKGTLWTEFLKSFRNNLRQSLILWVMLLGFLVVFCADYVIMLYWKATGIIGKMMPYVFVLLIVFVVVWAHYAFVYLSRFEDSAKITIKNCLKICIANFGHSLLLATIFIVSVLVHLMLPIAFTSILFFPAVYAVITCEIINKTLEKYMPE